MSLKPVCLLLSLCFVSSASALGLGELNVRSSLGQPLHATVTLLGTTAETTADCFSIGASDGGIPALPRTQLSLLPSGDGAVLHIRTRQPVNEPIAQFVLISDCETRLRRDYTVLLDPPVQASPATISQAVPADTPPPEAAPASRASPPQPQTRRPKAASSTPVARSRPSPSPSLRTIQRDPAPRLVLSGRRNTGNAPLALKLDTSLPDLDRARPEGLTATELSDENTALTRKLAHLEAQLLELQQRNAALETRRDSRRAPVTPPPEQPAKWPLYLLFLGLISAGIGLFAWLLHRKRSKQPALVDDSPWAQSDGPMMSLPPVSAGPEAVTQPEPERVLDLSEPPRDEGTELKEDILDQAEVFMAHGHGELAVHLLQEHLREAPNESPVPWLLLLDLLHREGNTEAYAAASTECRRYFNVNLAGYPVSQDSEQGLGLEAYPHLLEQLVKVWATPEIDTFFHDLIYDNRGGTRMGFEPGAYREILLLRAIAHDALPLAA